ncbi:hypothetical protein [Rhizobium sp. 18065]|uniref:hypothetical protein n=1 Tax=Rhizobium sp. 18065 TaxID=2681411 RepID=UPI001356A135|nr:hypothetical protein [Rhizobium sp. 18065]
MFVKIANIEIHATLGYEINLHEPRFWYHRTPNNMTFRIMRLVVTASRQQK